MKKIYKEINIKQPVYVAILDNGVTLCVYGNTAEGSDGKIYHCVEKQIGDDEFEFIGWECEGE